MKRLVVLLAALALSGVAPAQTQYELNDAADKAYHAADDALNASYKNLLAELDDQGKKKLQVAQRAWIAFRDAECESQSDRFRNGSIQPLIYADCAKLLTEARTAELK